MLDLRPGRHTADFLFLIALFCVLLSSAFLVILLGANVYRGVASGLAQTDNSRTALLYVTEKLRQNDTEGAVALGTLDGTEALVIERGYPDGDYRTYIYFHDGYLRELFVPAGQAAAPEDGQPLLELAEMEISREGTGWRVTASGEDGRSRSVWLSPRCARAGEEDAG